MKKQVIAAAVSMAIFGWAQAADCVSGTAYFTTGYSTCTVPAGVSTMQVAVSGAGGGGGPGAAGGSG